MEKFYFILFCLAAASASLPIGDETECTGEAEFIPHENCSLYYHCSNSVPILQSCPAGYFFNTRLEICDYPSNVPECQGGTRPPPLTTTTTSSPTTTSSLSSTTVPTTTGSSSTTTTDKPTTPFPIEERNCGQIINETTGHIAYKLNEEYGNYERCAWTISVPGASKFRFILQKNNFERHYDGIFITGIGSNGTEVAVQTAVLNDTANSVLHEVVGHTAIVLFYSDSTITGTGFLLSFSVEVDHETPIVAENYIYTTRHGEELIHDRNKGDEKNNQLTTLLHVAPLRAKLSSLFVGSLGVDESCYDNYMRVLKLKYGVPPPTWEEGGRFCSSPLGGISTENPDVTLYILKNGSGVGGTFEYAMSFNSEGL